MLGYVITQIILIGIFGLLGWVIRYKKMYSLISGFDSRPEEEKKQLIANGFPQKIGSLLLTTAGILLLLLPLNFTSYTFRFEIQLGFMLIYLMGGLIYLTKYEVKNKRKRSYLIHTALFIIVIGSITALSVTSYQGYELRVKENSFEVTGMYGDEWNIKNIKRIELMDEMPEVTMRTNGIGLPTLSKGHFKVKGYGSSLLFIQKSSSPYIYIELPNKKIFINDKQTDTTRKWFERLNEKATIVK